MTWQEIPDPVRDPPSLVGWALLGLRGIAFGLITLVMFLVFLLVRLLPNKWLANKMVGAWNHIAVWFCGIKVRRIGIPMKTPGARVSNHASWMDPLILRVGAPMQFVSKSEVASWPGIGILARTSGVVFIERRRSRAASHRNVLLERLNKGEKLCFFPEGTSSDGRRVLPFKSTLFAAFMGDDMRDVTWIQPMSLIYLPRADLPDNFFGWWGGMGFADHIIQVLSKSWSCEALVIFHDPVRAADFPDRKALARHCEAETRKGFADHAPQMAAE